MKYNKLAIGVASALGLFVTQVTAEQAQEVETIVITGQKIDRSLKETPNSVAVVTTEDIEKQNAQNISDVFAGMANVAGELRQGFSIRGVDAFNVSGGGNSYLATMYLDGAPLPYRLVRSGAIPVWDLSQVEVFRGPQSTLQGRNSLAGAVHIRTQDPTYEWTGKAKVTLGNQGQREYAFAGGGALIEDMLAFRVAIEDKNLDGDIYNYTRREESNYEESETVRAKVLFQPTEDFTALMSFSNTDAETGPNWSTYYYGDSAFDRETWYNSHIWEKTDTDISTLELSYNVTDELSVQAIFTSNESVYGYNWDGDLTPVQVTADNQYTRTDKTDSGELRVTYDGDDLEVVAGIYYSNLEVGDDAYGERFIHLTDVLGVSFETAVTGFLMQNGFDAVTAGGLATQVSALYPNIDPIVLSFTSDLAQEVTSKALFADVKYSINESFDLLAGIRFDKEQQTNASNAIYKIENDMPNPAAFDPSTGALIGGINAYLNSFADAASGIEPPSSADFDAFLPKLGVSYHINENITTSFIYQKGFRSGGVGTNIADNYLFTYDAEYTDNFELSYRSVWLNGDLMFNANAFFTQWQDQQVQSQLSTRQYDVVTINAGESEIYGFETEVFYYPSENVSITAGVGYAKSEFKDFRYDIPGTDITRVLDGNSFADAPEWTASVAVNYDFESGAFLNINANYQNSSTAYVDPERSTGISNYNPKNDARALINAQLGYDFGTFIVRIDMRNLLDEEYITNFFSDAVNSNAAGAYGQHQIGRSRQYGLTLQTDF